MSTVTSKSNPTARRRLALLALVALTALAASGCDEIADISDVQWYLRVVNQTEPRFDNTPSITVDTVDGTQSLTFSQSSKGNYDLITSYIGGHYTLIAHISSQAALASYRAERDKLEDELKAATNQDLVVNLIGRIRDLNEQITEANHAATLAARCTGEFVQNRVAYAQVVLLSETEIKVECNTGTSLH